MTQFSEIALLFKKEMMLEWRQKYALGGILLYVTSTVFVVYLSFVKVLPDVWNALFWIISLFASINAVVKSFVQENSNRQLYYYQLANPTAVILSKIFYNIFILLIINLLTFIVLGLMVGNPVSNTPQYLLAIVLGSIGFSITFTFISAIAAKANNAATLMAILSFPVILPVLITLIRLSKNALQNKSSHWLNDIQTLGAIDAILIALCFVLFPYLWRD
ncbi:MAG: heme exporter protein CcmB [Saprospiraceae bacterium]|nr:heme exporter protein CcmB [Saprospiraceae bacterium]